MSRIAPTNVEKMRALPWVNAYSGMNSAFCQLTVFGSVFILFLSDLGFKKAQIGGLLSLLPFCSMLSVLTSPYVARLGFKRSFVIFWGSRTVVISALLPMPWYLAAFGPNVALGILAAILLLFAICRSVGETAWYPWSHEVIPPSIRGKFGAVNTMVQTLSSMTAILAAGWVLGLGTGLSRYQWLFGGGLVLGAASVVAMSFVPGGAALTTGPDDRFGFSRFRAPIRDRNFIFYLAGVGLVTLGCSLMAFGPLYLKESIGLVDSQVVLVQGGGMIGVLASSYLWGWAADRYGSKPVMLLGLMATVTTPFLWFILPRHSAWSMPLGMAVSAAGALAFLGYGIGSSRQLFTDVVPQERRTEYFSLFCAWAGLLSGLGPLLAGQVLQLTGGLHATLGPLTFDAYSPLYAASALLMLGGAVTLSKTRSDSTLSTAEFAGMFLRGNPLMAIESKLRYSRALEEPDRAMLTRRLSRSGSPLSSDELIEALYDPSFNVRHEAIFAITQMSPDFRLIEAMWRVAEGDHPDGPIAARALPHVGRVSRRRNVRQLIEAIGDGRFSARYEAVIGLSRVRPEPAVIDALTLAAASPEDELAIAAVWALSRLGDPQAIIAGRAALNSDRPRLAAHAARALGTMGDRESLPVMLERFRALQDPALRLAYASALGAMRAAEASGEMLAMLPTLGDEVSRAEVVLAVARIVGGERDFTRLWRKVRRNAATGLPDAMIAAKKRLRRFAAADARLPAAMDSCIESLAGDDMPAAATRLAAILEMLPASQLGDVLPAVLSGCRSLLATPNPALRECLVLGLHAFNESLNRLR